MTITGGLSFFSTIAEFVKRGQMMLMSSLKQLNSVKNISHAAHAHK